MFSRNNSGGNGLDIPSGSYLKFAPDGQASEIGVKRARTPQSRPRLAVALDFADILGAEDRRIGPLFTQFEQQREGGPFHIEVNPRHRLPAVRWIDDIRLYMVQNHRITRIDTRFEYRNENNQYQLHIVRAADIDYSGLRKKAYFIEFRFTDALLSHPAFAQYDADTPWIWRMEFVDRQREAIELLHQIRKKSDDPIAYNMLLREEERIRKTVRGLRIRRHEVHGEIPDLVEYSKNFPVEYKFPWTSKRKSGDEKA